MVSVIGAGVGDLGAAEGSLVAAGEAGPGVTAGAGVGDLDLGATDDSLTVSGEAGPGVGDLFPFGEVAADAGD